MSKEGVISSPIFEIEVKGLGTVRFFKDEEKSCCWFTVNSEDGFNGWAYAKPGKVPQTVEFGAVQAVLGLD